VLYDWTSVYTVCLNSSNRSNQKCSKPPKLPFAFFMIKVSISNLLAQRSISVGDLVDEIWIRIVQHHMEMLHRMNRLQSPPVLEPNNLCHLISPRYLQFDHVMLTFSFPILLPKVSSTKSSISFLASTVKSSVAASSSSSNFVQTTKCTIFSSIP
jgi:hypothetical protein